MFKLFSYTLMAGAVIGIFYNPHGGTLLALIVSLGLCGWAERGM